MNNVKNQTIKPDILLGIADAEFIKIESPICTLHPKVVEPFLQLVASAREAGFDLRVASSYRNFARQLLIWNNKATGVRPLLDADGNLLDVSLLNPKEILFAILYWSALPGASRHHWGTDFDVYDNSRIDDKYSLQLTVDETEGDGPFAEFHEWLSDELKNNANGFFRPYVKNKGGVAPEPWHLSYEPIARDYSACLSEELLRHHIQSIDIELKQTLLQNFDEVYQQYIKPYC